MSITGYLQARVQCPARMEQHHCRCPGCRYSELSWDVVEPVTYFTSQLWAILGYCYFLASPLASPHAQKYLVSAAALGNIPCPHVNKSQLSSKPRLMQLGCASTCALAHWLHMIRRLGICGQRLSSRSARRAHAHLNHIQ